MAIPISQGGEVRCVLYVEDAQPGCFDYALEDALAVLLELWGQCARQFDDVDTPAPRPAATPARPGCASAVRRVTRQRRTDALFIDGEYVIRGLAGAILWKMLAAWCEAGQTRFTSRALRCDTNLHLPEVADNLSARLILLQRRLEQLDVGVRLVRSGRGAFELDVATPLSMDSEAVANGAETGQG